VPDFESDLRRHYGSQQLPDERVRAILGAGRATAARAARRRWLLGAAAAVVMAGIGGIVIGRAERNRISGLDVAGAVMVHFSAPDYTMAEVSADRAALERWVREHGGPAHLDVPLAMQGLQSYGCQVIEAHGQKVFLICFFLDSGPTAPGAMPLKKEMVITAPDGSMMKKSRPLVHLVVAPRAAFRDVPAPGTKVRLAAGGEWNLEMWRRGDSVYLAVAAAPAGKITELTRVL
jgi:hypothetical protein